MTLTTPQIRLFCFTLNFLISARTIELKNLEIQFSNAEHDETHWARRQHLNGCMSLDERNSIWGNCDERLVQLDGYIFEQNEKLRHLKSFREKLKHNLFKGKK